MAVLTAWSPLRAVPASAAGSIIISEVAPWSSGNSPLGADWFEVTNTGATRRDDHGLEDRRRFARVCERYRAERHQRIGPGESVIFIETASPATAAAAFRTLWFGANPPAGLQIGSYSGARRGPRHRWRPGQPLRRERRPPGERGIRRLADRPHLRHVRQPCGAQRHDIAAQRAGHDGAAAANDANEIGSPGTIGTPGAGRRRRRRRASRSTRSSRMGLSGRLDRDHQHRDVRGGPVRAQALWTATTTHTKYSIPAGTSLAAGGLLVVDQAQFGFELDNVDSVRALRDGRDHGHRFVRLDSARADDLRTVPRRLGRTHDDARSQQGYRERLLEQHCRRALARWGVGDHRRRRRMCLART